MKGKLENVNGIVKFALIVKKATCLMTIRQYNLITVSHPSLNELRSKKEIIWMNALKGHCHAIWQLYKKLGVFASIECQN